MLGKLLKHEWKATWKLPAALAAFTLIMTILGCLSFKMPLWGMLVSDSMEDFTFFDLLPVVILITYFISVIVSVYAVMIYFAIRFYKNLFTDEGYLMHTLPVKPRMLLISKLLTSAFWSLVSTLLMLCSMLLLLYFMLRTLIGETDWNMVTTVLSEITPEIDTVFREYGGMSLAGAGTLFLVILIAGSFSGMLLIYVCICIGQLFKKHKVAASIIAYLVVTSITQTISSIAVLPFSFSAMLKIEETTSNIITSATSPMTAVFAPMASMMPIYYVSLALSLISAVACYFVSEYITRRKLNLD